MSSAAEAIASAPKKVVDLKIAPVDHEAAKFAVMRWHYSRRMPSGALVMFGVWEDQKYIGCVIFGKGANNRIGDAYGLHHSQACELVRVALANHQSTVTQIVAQAIRKLKQNSPGLRLIVSYADPAEGHHDGIYQAGNWIYTGQTSGDKKYIDAAGNEYHSRSVSPTGYKRQFGTLKPCPNTKDLREIKTPGKYKYLYPLDRKMRAQAQKLSKPYPKKGAEHGNT